MPDSASYQKYQNLPSRSHLPRRLLQLPYDLLNRLNRRKLLRDNGSLTASIRMDDYRIAPIERADAPCFDLFAVARR